MRKVVRNNESEEKTGKGESKDSGVGQRQTATAARLAVARAPLFPPGSFSSFSSFLLLFSRRASERRTSWALLCLSSTLRSFVLFRAPLEGLIAAHTRSPFVSSFCHLFSTILSSLSSQPFGSPPSPPCSFARRTPTDTTDHDANREGRLSHSPHSLLSRVPPLLNIAVPMLFLSSHPTSFEDAENLSFRPLSFPREKRSVFVSRPLLHLSRSRPDRARLVLSILSSVT